mgnify:FL=1
MFDFVCPPTYDIDWFSTTGKLILFGIVFVVGGILLLLLPKKNKKAIQISKISIAVVLSALEIGRIVWYYLRHLQYGDIFNVWIRINFHMCTIMVWANVLTLLLSTFLKKDNKVLCALYNITFGIGIFGAIMTFVYPEFIDPLFAIWNFRNSQTIFTHILLIVTPIYLLLTKHFKIEIKNLWYNAMGLLLVGNISSLAGACANFNFAYCFYCNFLTSIGINIDFPYYIWFLFLVILLIDYLVYFMFEIVRAKRQHKKLCFKFSKFDIFGTITTFIFVIIHAFVMQAILPNAPTNLGWLFLVPMSIYLAIIVFLNYYLNSQKLNKPNKSL